MQNPALQELKACIAEFGVLMKCFLTGFRLTSLIPNVCGGCLQGLGLAYAQSLASSSSSCLVLTSRSAAVDRDTLASLAKRDAAVFVVRSDASDAASAAAVLEWVRDSLPPLQHYAHAAGVSDFDLLGSMTDSQLWHIAQPKVTHNGNETLSCGMMHYSCNV